MVRVGGSEERRLPPRFSCIDAVWPPVWPVLRSALRIPAKPRICPQDLSQGDRRPVGCSQLGRTRECRRCHAPQRAMGRRSGFRPGDYGMAIATIHEARFVLFDDDTRLAFITSFDGPWDAYMEDFFTSGPTLALFDVIFRHVEGYEGLPDLAAVRTFVLGAQVTAAAYARNYGGTVKEIRKGLRVNDAFQRVLDDPDAGEALQHPALKPLLDEAAD